MKGVFFSNTNSPKYEIRDFDIPTPGEDEVLIKNVAVASNPKDWKVSRSTLLCDRLASIVLTHHSGNPVSETQSSHRLSTDPFDPCSWRRDTQSYCWPYGVADRVLDGLKDGRLSKATTSAVTSRRWAIK
jgi:hypothetical protein